MTSIWTKLSLWQSESVSWIPVYQSTCISAYKYTSLPVYQSHQSVSIPVHLYTSHSEIVSIPVHLYTSHSEIQYASPPVYQSQKYQYTSLPVYQSLPSPHYHHLMSTLYESSPLAAVVYESSPLAAVVISTWTTSVPTALVWNWASRTTTIPPWWKYQASRTF